MELLGEGGKFGADEIEHGFISKPQELSLTCTNAFKVSQDSKTRAAKRKLRSCEPPTLRVSNGHQAHHTGALLISLDANQCDVNEGQMEASQGGGGGGCSPVLIGIGAIIGSVGGGGGWSQCVGDPQAAAAARLAACCHDQQLQPPPPRAPPPSLAPPPPPADDPFHGDWPHW
jgi:hypothetical protein